jgi:glycosyltransferase involved in cell wall biosynthesis
VTIAMPCLNEEPYLEACLRSLVAQDYPPDRLEILVGDGGSTDGTVEVLAGAARSDPRIRLVVEPHSAGRSVGHRWPHGAALNQMILEARGEVIVRMDVHCEYAPDYVRRCVEELERTGADNVGGAQRLASRSFFQAAVCAALRSPLGTGGARYRDPEAEGDVDTVFLGAFRRDVFDRIGGFQPGEGGNEDADLNQRIVEAGGRVHLSRGIVVRYFPRDSLGAVARQYFRHGRGRAGTVLRRGRPLTLRPLVPFLALGVASGLAAVSPLRPLFGLCAVAYAATTGFEALRVGWSLGPRGVAVVWAIFPVMHVAHGLGFAAGLASWVASKAVGLRVEQSFAEHAADRGPLRSA